MAKTAVGITLTPPASSNAGITPTTIMRRHLYSSGSPARPAQLTHAPQNAVPSEYRQGRPPTGAGSGAGIGAGTGAGTRIGTVQADTATIATRGR
jgi:hypothetical protein